MEKLKIIYMDNNATTKIDQLVQEDIFNGQEEYYGNASSAHPVGQAARAVLEVARTQLGQTIRAVPGEIYFTSGGTESNFMALNFIERRPARRAGISAIEHPSIYNIMDHTHSRIQYEIAVIPVSKEGVVDLDFIKDKLIDAGFISVMLANNETGVIQPIAEISEIIHREKKPSKARENTWLHVDACQAFGKMEIDVSKLDVDLMSICAHKMHGPKGIGALYVRRGLSPDHIFVGGNQERGTRPGTENVPGALGFARAAETAYRGFGMKKLHMLHMRDLLWNGLNAKVIGIRSNTPLLPSSPETLCNTLNVSFSAVDSDALLLMLAEKGICVSSGSACHAGMEGPSRVLQRMGVEGEWLTGVIRFSLSRYNTMQEVELVVEAVAESVDALRKMAKRMREAGLTDAGGPDLSYGGRQLT